MVDGEFPEKLPKPEEHAKPNNIKRVMTEEKDKKNPKKPKICDPPDTFGDDSNDSGVSSSSEGHVYYTTDITQIVYPDLPNPFETQFSTWNLANANRFPGVRETELPELGPMLRNDPNLSRKSVCLSSLSSYQKTKFDMILTSQLLWLTLMIF